MPQCVSAADALRPPLKLEGYTAGGARCGDLANSDDTSALVQIPIAGMTVAVIHPYQQTLDQADTPKGFKTNDNTFVQESSLFYGGQVYCNLGAFIQGTYERPGSSYFLDNTDSNTSFLFFPLLRSDVLLSVLSGGLFSCCRGAHRCLVWNAPEWK